MCECVWWKRCLLFEKCLVWFLASRVTGQELSMALQRTYRHINPSCFNLLFTLFCSSSFMHKVIYYHGKTVSQVPLTIFINVIYCIHICCLWYQDAPLKMTHILLLSVCIDCASFCIFSVFTLCCISEVVLPWYMIRVYSDIIGCWNAIYITIHMVQCLNIILFAKLQSLNKP